MSEHTLYFAPESVRCHFVLNYRDVLLHSFPAEITVFCSIINTFYLYFKLGLLFLHCIMHRLSVSYISGSPFVFRSVIGRFMLYL
jgi:hypothetical protein